MEFKNNDFTSLVNDKQEGMCYNVSYKLKSVGHHDHPASKIFLLLRQLNNWIVILNSHK